MACISDSRDAFWPLSSSERDLRAATSAADTERSRAASRSCNKVRVRVRG